MTDENPDVGLTGYDDSSSAGYICKECGALVPRMPSFTTRHTDWHGELAVGSVRRERVEDVLVEDDDAAAPPT
jgi:hypothetical protein